MGVNKVIYYGEVLVDMSQVTVTPETMFEGETALGADGELKTGSFTIQQELTEQDTLLTELEAALEGKASGEGGSEINTSNVTVNVSGTGIWSYICFYSSVENGAAQQKIYIQETSGAFTLTAQCGSYLHIVPSYLSGTTVSNAEVIVKDSGSTAGVTVLLPEDNSNEVTISLVGD